MGNPDDLDATRIAALAVELRGLAGKLRRRLREQVSPGALTWSQIAVLGQIAREGPASVSALARAENMRPQSMGAIIAALEAAGQVNSTPDPQDARRSLISLTEAGSARIRSDRAAREDWLFQTISHRFSPAEQRDLERGIALIRRLVDE